MKVETFQNKVNDEIKENMHGDENMEGNWEISKEAVIEIVKTEVGYKKKSAVARKPWVSKEMLS